MRQLAPHVEGRKLERSGDARPALVSRRRTPSRWPGRCAGGPSSALRRRGKYLVWELSGDVFLLLHLRMTGTLLLDPDPPPAHLRARLGLGDGHVLAYCDPRRFGTGELARGAARLERSSPLASGVEPLGPEFTEPHLRGTGARACGRRSRRSCSISGASRGWGTSTPTRRCSARGIHPLRAAGALTSAPAGERCATRWSRSLTAGIDAGGATIDDYRDADGVAGAFQDGFLVHLRDGRAVPALRHADRQVRGRGRGTYACERCQPRPRRRGLVAARLRSGRASSSLSLPLRSAATRSSGSRRGATSPTTICGKRHQAGRGPARPVRPGPLPD